MSYTEMNNTRIKLSLISERVKREPNTQFTSLAHLLSKSFLEDCFNNLNRNKAKGIDNVSWKDYNKNLNENLEKLVVSMKRKKYKPLPAKRVYIPKNETDKRPLGISAIENKIVESGIAKILESIYEVDFLDFSYGFRPKRNTHQALAKVDNLITAYPVNHIVEADIKGFFDNVNHEMLMNFIKIRIIDPSLLYLIELFLKVGYIDAGLLVQSDKGTPQGSILSPILANIFLHYVLDCWFETVVKPEIRGFCDIVRYADDFVCVVQYIDEAKRIEKGLRNRFTKYKLELHPDKTRIFSFGTFEDENSKRQSRKSNTFNFLGFTHYCDRTRKGNFKVGRKTSQKKFKAKCKDMNNWLKSIRNLIKTKEWWKILKSKLGGHIQYYGVSGNYPAISNFYSITIKLVHKWLNRRSQKKRMSWDKLNNYLKCYPLPKPSIKHNLYILAHTM